MNVEKNTRDFLKLTVAIKSLK